MELDSFLASPRWEILEIIAKTPKSPIELSEKLGTTVSYISQQLKLLEAAGLVSKKRTGAVDRGKPRTLFSTSRELAYVVSLTNNFSQKKLINLTDHHKIILKIWSIDNPLLHRPIERFYWKIENLLEKIDSILVDTSGFSPKILILTEDKKIKQKIEFAIKNSPEKIDFEIISKKQATTLDFDFITSIYDTQLVFEKIRELKGGIKDNE